MPQTGKSVGNGTRARVLGKSYSQKPEEGGDTTYLIKNQTNFPQDIASSRYAGKR